jgi:hypothetical protein
MARPLNKHYPDGTRYFRPLEAAVDAALAQDVPTLCRRAAIQDRHSAEYLPPECLVHLIREARRQSDEATMNSLLPFLLRRCEANLRSKVSEKIPNASVLREEILGQFSELFASDGLGGNPNELDYFEIHFNAAFRAFRIDILRKEKRTERVRGMSHVPLPGAQEHEQTSDDEIFIRLSDKFPTPATQEGAVALKELMDEIKALPRHERDAVVLCHVMGYDEESDNPNKTTAATLCGVTGRTIRNRLTRAAAKLSRFKEVAQ